MAGRRYASLYFLACVDDDDNELIVLETIHHFVEVPHSVLILPCGGAEALDSQQPGLAPSFLPWHARLSIWVASCLESRPHLLQVLDRYFGNVCELDLIFNFHKVRGAMRHCDAARRKPRYPRLSLASHRGARDALVQLQFSSLQHSPQAYHILDELLIAGELQEPSKKAILRVTAAQDALMEGTGDSKVSDSKYEI